MEKVGSLFCLLLDGVRWRFLGPGRAGRPWCFYGIWAFFVIWAFYGIVIPVGFEYSVIFEDSGFFSKASWIVGCRDALVVR